MGALKYRNPATGAWELAGVPGPAGLDGIQGPPADDIYVGPDDPSIVKPTTELWFDTDEDEPLVAGPPGPPGPQGVQGPPGPATLIVGTFLPDPSTLPATGLIPVDFNGPGDPAAAVQLQIGESLYHMPTDITDPGYGDLWQFISNTGTGGPWLNLGKLSGPPGPEGADGPEGPPGDMTQAIADTRYLQLAGGTVTGPVTITSSLDVNNAYLSLNGDGYGIIFHGDAGRIYKKSGAGIIIRRHADLAVQTESSDGLTRWNMLDTGNIVGTTKTVSFQNGWSGAMDFRVSPAMVTCRIQAVKRNAVTNAFTESKICDYPSGVPGPYSDLWQTTTIREADYTTYPGNAIVSCRSTTGVWVRMTSDGMTANDRYIDCTISWAR